MLDRERLEKLCGMFGSQFAGERANAAAAADKLVRDAGMRWRDVVVPAPPQPVILYERDAIALVLGHANLLTEWERGFIGSLRQQRYPLSDKQLEILDQIVTKVRRGSDVA